MEERDGLHWSDQPIACAAAEVIARLYLPSIGVVEVRSGPECWYLTAGNLWGSQTVRCRDAIVAWRLLHQLCNEPKKGRPLAPIEGAELIE